MTTKRKRRSGRRLDANYQSLEARKMFASASIQIFQDIPQLVIEGTRGHDQVIVSEFGEDQVAVSMQSIIANGSSASATASTAYFSKSDFQRIRFLGRRGDDTFTNDTDVDSSASGHKGNDVLNGGNGNNWLRGGSGNDKLTGGDANDVLRGLSGNDRLDGGKRHDRIAGGDGNDVIIGRSGDDLIFGNYGNDTIFGGNGDDEINGGAGRDTIHFGKSTDHSGDAAVFDDVFAQYAIESDGAAFEVSGPGASPDVMSGVDVFRFADGDVAADDALISLSEAERESLRLLNQYRASHGRSRMELKTDVSDFAQRWAREQLAPLGYNPTQVELESKHVMSASDIAELLNGERTMYRENFVYLGPQVTSPQEAARRMHSVLTSSSVHRANMLNTDITEVGVGIVQTSNGWYLVHSFFAT